jgi:hypothetical protein
MRGAAGTWVRATLSCAAALCFLGGAASTPAPEDALVTWLASVGGDLGAGIRRATQEQPRGVHATRAYESACGGTCCLTACPRGWVCRRTRRAFAPLTLLGARGRG